MPIEEIKLRIVEESEKKADEKFEMIDGIPTKNITQKEYEEIVNDYNENKKDYQSKITQNEDGTYSLPMNYPVGLADIEQYMDMSNYEGGKSEFIKKFAKIPRMYFIGEHEEEVEGHFAYSDGELLSGEKYKSGDDLGENASSLYETEKASMHNRVMDYVATNRILFGKGKNDKWNNYIKLVEQLGMTAESKIYEGVGHGTHVSKEFNRDSAQFYEAIDSGKEIHLDDKGRASEVNPIHQLKRRFLVSKNKEEFETKRKMLEKISDEELKQLIEKYIDTLDNQNGKNRYQLMDSLSSEDLQKCISERIQENNITAIVNLTIDLTQECTAQDIKLSTSKLEEILHRDENTVDKEKEEGISTDDGHQEL